MTVADQVTDPSRYALIPRVLIFPVNENGKILLLKGAANKKIWPNLWNGVGGHVEKGESVISAAIRELKEETGLESSKIQFCGQVIVDTGDSPGIIFFIYKAKGLSGEIVPSVEGELGWYSQAEALKLDLVEDLYTVIPIVMRHRPNSRAFWGFYNYDSEGQAVMSFSS